MRCSLPVAKIKFPEFSGVRCLMMPYIQGDPDSVPSAYQSYREIIRDVVIKRGDVGFLTIDESLAKAGSPHRGKRAKYGRALHTEGGIIRDELNGLDIVAWGGSGGSGGSGGGGGGKDGSGKGGDKGSGGGDDGGRYPVKINWGGRNLVQLDPDVEVLLANNIDGTCALWDADHFDTSDDGDIGYAAELYPYESATMMKAGDVHRIGVFTPHESLPVVTDVARQFLRIVSSGVHGREPYFTENPLLALAK